MCDKLYKIVRFTFNDDHPDNHRVIARNLSLEEAQLHCKRIDTSGEDAARGKWFDGYEEQS